MKPLKSLLAVAVSLLIINNSAAQKFKNVATQIKEGEIKIENQSVLPDELCDSIIWASVTDSLLYTVVDVDTMVNFQPLPKTFFLPAVYSNYHMELNGDVFESDYSGNEALRWLEDANALAKRQLTILQNMTMTHPYAVRYNIWMLPEAPKKYDVVINPEDYTISLKEQMTPTDLQTTVIADEIVKRHWIHDFVGNLQFSQAYVSPNWYQGGNNNLNMLLDLKHSIKLNQKFHPNYLFETTFQYRLGFYSTPDDPLRSYNISQDLFQVNSTLGIKAIKKWYYTVTGMFKTQFFNSYQSNTTNLRSAFLSPGELNLGLGMTYNTANKDKSFTFDASISPLSYNLMICLDNRMNKGSYGIKPDKNSVSKAGSSMEYKLGLKITDNIKLSSRLFGFTDFKGAYTDLENTLVFEINKYLTTQIYVHLRYDTNTKSPDPDWHKLQVKEILSMGFTYKIGTL